MNTLGYLILAGFEHVIAIGSAESLSDNEAGVLLFIRLIFPSSHSMIYSLKFTLSMPRFDNFDAMKSWTIDINNEANSSISVSLESYDWWNEIYDRVGYSNIHTHTHTHNLFNIR